MKIPKTIKKLFLYEYSFPVDWFIVILFSNRKKCLINTEVINPIVTIKDHTTQSNGDRNTLIASTVFG